MPTASAVLASIGGLVALATAVTIVVRAIFRQIGATERNTDATRANTERLEQLARRVDNHGERLARLEGPPRLPSWMEDPR